MFQLQVKDYLAARILVLEHPELELRYQVNGMPPAKKVPANASTTGYKKILPYSKCGLITILGVSSVLKMSAVKEKL